MAKKRQPRSSDKDVPDESVIISVMHAAPCTAWSNWYGGVLQQPCSASDSNFDDEANQSSVVSELDPKTEESHLHSYSRSMP